MTNQSMSASHQVSISHDPLEEGMPEERDQERFARDAWPSGGARPRHMIQSASQRMLPAIDVSDLRPALLAGAVGLFAAWIVSGMSGSRTSSQRSRGSHRHRVGYVADRDEPRFPNRPEPTRGPRTGYSGAGPEGRSSRADFTLDAMNP